MQPKHIRSAEQKARHGASNKRWYQANKERLKEAGRLYYLANKEHHNAVSRAWRATHKERKRAADKAWYEANKERHARVTKAWATKNAAKKKADDRAYYEANAEQIRAKNRHRYEAHYKETAKIKVKEWTARNPERSRAIKKKSWLKLRDKTRAKQIAWARRWKANNPDRARAGAKAWRAANPEKVSIFKARGDAKRRATLQNAGSFTLEEWNALLDATGHKCVCCGVPEADALYCYRGGTARFGHLTRDHIKPLCKGGDNRISNLQPTCLRCNTSKNDKHINYLPAHLQISK